MSLGALERPINWVTFQFGREFERDIIEQMEGSLKGGGFDAERDIAALTVNRWPHGYAWEYNDSF